jgi:hypothetical protein
MPPSASLIEQMDAR